MAGPWLDDVLESVELAFRLLAEGRLVNPPRREHLGRPGDPNYFRLEMPATLLDSAGRPLLTGIKVIEEAGAVDELGTRRLGERTARLDLRHEPSGRAISLEADELTDWRTGAAVAVAADHLLPAVETVLVVGTGRVARATVLALDRLLQPRRISATSRQERRREAFAAGLAGSLTAELHTPPLEQAPFGADLVVAAVPATQPVLTQRAATARLLVVVEGDPRSCQVAPELFESRTLMVDDAVQALATGSCQAAAVRARLAAGEVVRLADVVAGRLEPSAGSRPLVLLTGLAALDLMVGARLWRRRGGPADLP